jgi:hypothetical protein
MQWRQVAVLKKKSASIRVSPWPCFVEPCDDSGGG